MKVVFDGNLTKLKATKNTVVYHSQKFGSIYTPNILLPEGEAPDQIHVTIAYEEK